MARWDNIRKKGLRWAFILSLGFTVTTVTIQSTNLAIFVEPPDYLTVHVPQTAEARDPSIGGHNRDGVLSTKHPIFFRHLRDEIDSADRTERCRRYGVIPSSTSHKRRIFLGALIADEPRELLEIVAAEAYGVYEAIVFVESNRTQHFFPRAFKRLDQNESLAELFGAHHVQVRRYVNENPRLLDLSREHDQRSEILKGWKELGMSEDDVGLLADNDESMTRDFLRAVQTCDFDFVAYKKHECNHRKVKLLAKTRVFEGSPECVTKGRSWYHPDFIVGHCIEGIGTHPPAQREKNSFLRRAGHGSGCQSWNIEERYDTNKSSWNAADFRRACGGRMQSVAGGSSWRGQRLSGYTAFHFHNFFASLNSTRFKYLSYGHPDRAAMSKRIGNLSNDLHMMTDCALGIPDNARHQKWTREPGGFDSLQPFWPIYFQDPEYRRRRHAFLKKLIEDDNERMDKEKQR